MNVVKNLALTLVGFGLAAIGLMLVLRAETQDDVLMGSVTALFFSACGMVGLMDLLPTSLPQRQPDGRIIIVPSRLRAGVFAFGGLAFLVAGIFIPLRMVGDGISIKLLLVALAAPFGLAALIFAGRQMFRSGPIYVMDETGIESRTGIKWRLRWTDISGISMGGAGPNMFLMLETRADVPDPPGAAARFNRRFNMPPYAIAQGTSGVNFGALAETVVNLWEAHGGLEAQA